MQSTRKHTHARAHAHAHACAHVHTHSLMHPHTHTAQHSTHTRTHTHTHTHTHVKTHTHTHTHTCTQHTRAIECIHTCVSRRAMSWFFCCSSSVSAAIRASRFPISRFAADSRRRNTPLGPAAPGVSSSPSPRGVPRRMGVDEMMRSDGSGSAPTTALRACVGCTETEREREKERWSSVSGDEGDEVFESVG
jgi:hypothetical protein